MDPTSDFQTAIVEYLEGAHQGEFISGTMESVAADIQKRKEDNPTHICPTETLPQPPPAECLIEHVNDQEKSKCQTCLDYSA